MRRDKRKEPGVDSLNTIFVKLRLFGYFETFTNIRTRIKWNTYWTRL
jgi:hypothetical protein